MLDGMANLDEEGSSEASRLSRCSSAIARDRNPVDQFHHKVRPATFSCAGIEDPRDVGMVHERERLTFRLKTGDHFPGVHADLEGYLDDRTATTYGLFLFGH